MTSSYFVAINISSGSHYRDIADLPLSPLIQSNGSILNDNDVVQQWHCIITYCHLEGYNLNWPSTSVNLKTRSKGRF